MTTRKLLLFGFAVVFTFPFTPQIATADVVPTDILQTAAHQDALTRTVDQAIDSVQRRYLDTEKHSPWQIMHGLLGLRYGFQMMDNGKVVNGLKWIAAGQSFDDESWFEVSPYGGRAHPFTRAYAFQGHDNQFLAVISMAGVPLKYEFKTADGRAITVADMVNNAKMEVTDESELAWTLWALSRYLPPDAEWTNKNGDPWSIEKIIGIQVTKPINGTYCGGTHSLFAMSHARNVYLRSGKKLRGPWLEADMKIRKHVELVRQQQNADGMFSTNFFVGRAYEQDFSKRLASAGHLLEFLMIALPQKQLNERWVRKGIQAVARDMISNSQAEAKCGPLYHATNGLVIFMDRTQPRRVRKYVEMNPQLESQPVNHRSDTIEAQPAISRNNTIEVITVAQPKMIELPVPNVEPSPEAQSPVDVDQQEDDGILLPLNLEIKAP